MNTITELKETAIYFGKTTKRQKSIFFKAYLKDLDYIIDHIEPQLQREPLAWHLGERITAEDLRNYKAEREYIVENFLELIN